MLITDKYASVMATRYRLQTRKMKEVDGKMKQIWDINCPARIDEGKKLQISEYIEEMNGIDSNIYFEVDEEATEKAHEYLRAKLEAKKEKDKNSNLSTNDAIGKLAEAINKGNSSKKVKKENKDVEDDPELEELRDDWKELTGKKAFHGWNADKLRNKIEEETNK